MLLYDIDLHPLLAAGEVSWDVMEVGQYHTCWWRKSLDNILLAVTVIEIVPYNWFCFGSCFLFVLGLGWFVFPLFPVYWYVVRSELYDLVILLSLKYFQDVESLSIMIFPLSSFCSW
jgi:hypothetical protein